VIALRRPLLPLLPLLALAAGPAGAVTIDFEGLANGTELLGAEFAGVTISSSDKGTSHLGPTIFDSSKPGPNDAGGDPDLLVGLGNVMILQNTAFPTQTVAGVFDTPNDEADFSPTGEGHALFTFDSAIELQTITLIDLNGGAEVDVLLTDLLGNTLEYEVPEMWTNDIDDCGFTCDGFAILDLQELGAQAGEPGAGGVTPAPTVIGAYDDTQVVTMELRFHGANPSAAIDDITFVPEPGTAVLVGLGLAAVGARRRSAS